MGFGILFVRKRLDLECPNHFEICLIRLHDCHVNVGFRLDVRHSIAHRFEKNSADRGKVSNLDGKLCQKTVAVSSVRPLEKFIELSANFLLIVFSNVIQVAVRKLHGNFPQYSP